MKLLFVCGASVSGEELRCAAWIKSLVLNLCGEYEITLASHSLASGEPVVFKSEGGSVTLRGLSAFCGGEADMSEYDVIVLFGTENGYTADVLKLCAERGLLDRAAVFAQGMAYPCALHYAEGVPVRVVKRYTLRDFLRRQNIKKEQAAMMKRAETEREALTLTRSFIGRTTMDKAMLRMYNPSADYYRCNDVLREPFYSGEWSADACEKHRIFISQYYYPLKGFHYLLEAAAILKKKYPSLRIAAAGYNPIEKPLPQKETKDSSYIRYVKKLIAEYGLEGNIELLGVIDEERMKEEYLKANVFVMPSSIENSPNSLAEAMMLGVPTVAADVGGVSDFAEHKTEAFIYPSPAVYLLAHYIDAVFEGGAPIDEMARRGRERALREYDREHNLLTFRETLEKIARKSD